MRLGLICDGEPGLGACRRLGRALVQEGAAVTLMSTAPPECLPTAAEEDSEDALGWLPLEPLAAATSDLVQGLDALGVFLEGNAVTAFRAAHRQASALRGQSPCLLFTGPVRPLCGDALMADLLPRLGYDLIALQGDAQRQELEWLLRSCGRSAQAHTLLGLWCLATEPIGSATTPDPVLLVLDETQVPPSPFANGMLYQRLRSIALQTPSWQVRLQPDGPLPADPADWPETSLLWHGLQDRQRPANLQLGEGDDLTLALMQASACLGIGSSWLITAMVWGKPTVVLGDFGIRTEFNGPFFFGSGCLARLADCLPLERLRERPSVNADWLAARGWAIADGPDRLLRRLKELRP
jgi:hypothetical protein